MKTATKIYNLAGRFLGYQCSDRPAHLLVFRLRKPNGGSRKVTDADVIRWGFEIK